MNVVEEDRPYLARGAEQDRKRGGQHHRAKSATEHNQGGSELGNVLYLAAFEQQSRHDAAQAHHQAAQTSEIRPPGGDLLRFLYLSFRHEHSFLSELSRTRPRDIARVPRNQSAPQSTGDNAPRERRFLRRSRAPS